ncbi:Serine-threonine/tyrosine-protein kinase, catalytic domain, partial [Dillenia turbinata]
YDISPSPASFSIRPPLDEGPPGPAYQANLPGSDEPNSTTQSNGYVLIILLVDNLGPVLQPPLASPPLKVPFAPETNKELTPSMSPSTLTVLPPSTSAPPPVIFHDISPTLPPAIPKRVAPSDSGSISGPFAPVPVVSSPKTSPENPPSVQPIVQGSTPPTTQIKNPPKGGTPQSAPYPPESVARPPDRQQKHLPDTIAPQLPPSNIPDVAVPVASSPRPREMPSNSPSVHQIKPGESPNVLGEPGASPLSAPPPLAHWKSSGTPGAAPASGTPSPIPGAAPASGTPSPLAPINHFSIEGSFPAVAPTMHKAKNAISNAPAPSLSALKSPPHNGFLSPAYTPPISFQDHHHTRNKTSSPPSASYNTVPPTSREVLPPPSYPPNFQPEGKKKHHAPPSHFPGSPLSTSSSVGHVTPTPAPSPTPKTASGSGHGRIPFLSPESSPSRSSSIKPKTPVLPPAQALPPPPPNQDCAYVTCAEPYTNTPPGSPCGCVLPIQVGLQLGVALYTFFPLVSEFAEEIAAGVFTKQSQVRIMGANEASQQPEKTIVLADLVPLGEKFDNTTAFLISQRFWQKQVDIKFSFFGDYEVLYVHYPGLPPSASSFADGQYPGQGGNGRTIHPLGVDVRQRDSHRGLNGGIIAIIVLSASIAVMLCFIGAWVLLFKHKVDKDPTAPTSLGLLPSMRRPPEERTRCLVYELIPNGSVESHLHGVDKETAPLDWNTRVKIALGAARGLAYLHEDSSPRVIHRDFKSSNILLDHDFTPKVSDFGLARTAMDEENRHISTRVMGTFGYVAPEYAMTGHLLVKSDVYSYGVVLLELLTGRKPVDMSRPPGQENLVAWVRPLLSSKEGLETIIDPFLGPNLPTDNFAKVAAIASMCVQPEVSHRPFMGEVVQALKLVCNECDEARVGSRNCCQEDLSIELDTRDSTGSGQLVEHLKSRTSFSNYDSDFDPERGLSLSAIFSTPVRLGRPSSGSFRRQCSSGPLRTGRRSRFWQKRFSGGAVSEHGAAFRFWPGSH